MSRTLRFLATSESPIARGVRRLYHGASAFTLPAPRVVTLPMRWTFAAARDLFHEGSRILVCEPIFKSYCRQHGARVRTGPFIHYIKGDGDIFVGDDVVLDGMISIRFAARFADTPTLRIGDRTGIGHECRFTIGREITLGNDCRIGPRVWMFDASGHTTDPEARRRGEAPDALRVRRIVVGDNVWIGGQSIVCPGVTIGEGAVVSAGSVVLSDVPPRTIVAGNPARMIGLTSSFHTAPAAAEA